MSTKILLVGLALGLGQASKDVTDADKQAFFKLLPNLPTQPAGHGPPVFTKEALKKAAPLAPVLFALTQKDLQKDETLMVTILTWQLAGVEEARQYGIKNFASIAHPSIKLWWSVGLFEAKAAPPEVVIFLRKALEAGAADKEEWFGYGPHFQEFKERVIRADEIGKQPKVELVKKHIKKNRFPNHGGGFSYGTANCTFAPGPLLIAARPLNNDKLGPKTDQQGELFTCDVISGASGHRLIPQPKGFIPKYDFDHYFSSPVLSVNVRGDLLCRWTMEGNSHHGFALLKKGSESFVVKRHIGLALQYDSNVVADPEGNWYLIHWGSGYCLVLRLDDALNLTQLGKLTSAEFASFRGCDARFIAKDVLHLAWNLRSVDFHVTSRKWLHHRQLHRPEQPGAGELTAVQLGDDSLHHLWSMDGGKEHPKLTGVYCQAESNLEPLKVCASRHYRAIAVGNRIVVCYTLENALTKVFFRVIHHGTMGPVSEIAVENKLDYSLWRDSMQLNAEADRIWFVNTIEPEAVYELMIVDRKR
jgi:hypothetical protein